MRSRGLGELCVSAAKGLGLVWWMAAASVLAQDGSGRQYTTADYARAEAMLSYNMAPLVYHTTERLVETEAAAGAKTSVLAVAPGAAWVEGDRLWYRDRGPDGFTYMLVDVAKASSGPAFDHGKLSLAVLAARPGAKVDEHHLMVSDLSFRDGKEIARVWVEGSPLRCEISGEVVCTAAEADAARQTPTTAGGRRRTATDEVVSPDKAKAAFVRDWNLWMRDTKSGAETQLTKDGVVDFGYATDNAGWKHSDAAILVWSPDSKKIATFQQDQRKTGMMYLLPVTNRHPKLEAWRYPLVGDKDVTTIERVVIEVDKRKVVRFKMPPDQHRSTICDDVSCDGGWEDVQWSADSKQVAFVSTSRDHRQEWMRLADAGSGDVREVYTETAPKFFESGMDKVNWHYLSKSNEFLWWTERSGWGHLALYDMATGKEKNAITAGEWNVAQVLTVDEQARKIYFVGMGREKGWDPYYRGYYSVGFDGSGLTLLTPEDKDHAITPSPDGKYFVDVASTPVEPQVTAVRDTSGKVALEVTKQDISKAVAAGWKPLTMVTVKGRDGKTDIYGYVWKPTNFDAAKRYPIVNYVYPGPQIGSCGSRSFSVAHGDNQALAELGFVVMCLDGMGTPFRSKAFHEAYYGDLGDNTLPDQVAGMKELAAKSPWIDLERAGIWGHSGGGNATGAAMLHYPEFFKVGIAESGNHDQRDYEDDWAEKWAGVEVVGPDGKSNYDSQANQNFAKNLKGHLLLAHGTMDDNVPPSNTLLLVDALIKANRDFDLLLIPNVHHGYGQASPYMMRRRWDYFVRYLAGATPPKEYQMTSYEEMMKRLNGPGVDDED